MVNYKDLGLVNTREMFKRAVAGGYAIPAFNFNTMEQMQAIVMAAVETKSPVIMQVSKGARNYANGTILRNLAKGAVEYAKELGCENPEIVLHLDHGDSFELCKDCIDNGFSSVMIDGSHLPYEENIALAKKVVDYAHQFDVTVEAELGVLAGVEDEVSAAESTYTKPEEVIDFSTRTGCDSLAISIGTSHGAHKFTPAQCTLVNGVLVPPPLAFDVLAEIEKKLHWHSTFSLRSRRSFLDSQSFSTVLLQFLWTRLTQSTSTAVSSRQLSVFLRSSSARLLSLLYVRSTSTLTHVSL